MSENNENCLFCKIVKKQIPAEIVLETKEVIAFCDIDPKAPIHYLIIPKTHISTINDISEDTITNFLYTEGVPEPDLIIRTGGDCRLSNFLLWQSAYSELLFIKKAWPDFTRDDFLQAVNEFNNRERRFGGC